MTGLLHKYGPRPILSVSHHSQDIPEQQVGRQTLIHSELLAPFVLSSSICHVVLLLLPLILFLQTWMYLILFSLCCFSMMSPSNRHLLIIFVLGFLRHISCTSLNSSSSPLSDSLCPQRLCLHLHSTWLLPPRFSQQLFRLALGRHPYMVVVYFVPTIAACNGRCQGLPNKSSLIVDSQASIKVCLVRLLLRTIHLLMMHEIALVRS